jgi:cytochrome d ubiquinol oxidase subunit I
VAELQPVKLAAMEAHYETKGYAPIIVGGFADDDTGEVRYGVALPWLLSLLLTWSPEGVVKGLRDFPRDTWPPTSVTHLSFDVMVGAGSFLLFLALWYLWIAWKGREFSRTYLAALVPSGAAAIVALEAGWTVTEVGRQPWIIYGFLRTRDAMTSLPHLVIPFLTFTVVYIALAAIVLVLLIRQFKKAKIHYKGENAP